MLFRSKTTAAQATSTWPTHSPETSSSPAQAAAATTSRPATTQSCSKPQKNNRLFSGIDAYISGDADPGLFIFSGKLSEGTSIEQAEQAIDHEIEKFIEDSISGHEIEKVINKTEARIAYSEINYQNKASNLAFFEFLGDINLINTEGKCYSRLTTDTIKQTARQIFRKENSSTLYYLKK